MATMGLLRRHGSLNELHIAATDNVFKEKQGLLRRVFTGSRRKRGQSKRSSNRARFSPPNLDLTSIDITIAECSPTADLVTRRGIFSRKHYGSVETLSRRTEDNEDGSRFRVETGERRGRESDTFHSPSTPLLENPEYQTRWYFKYFLGRYHQNYVGLDSDKNPFVLSILLSDANDHQLQQYRAILWRKTGTEKICLPYNPGKSLTVRTLLSCFSKMHKIEKGPKEVLTPTVIKDLLLLEEQEGSVNFKFGVLCWQPGQTTDNEMFSNETGTSEFNKFVGFLGETVKLRGWDRYRGGLDNKSNTTGTESIYTVYEGHEIMFHVAPLLPYSADNPQQVERKRHIGNDIVNIVFCETTENGDTPSFKPSMVKSQFTHVFAVVWWDMENSGYRLQVFSEESVPLFGPPLPVPPLFHDIEQFREFLIVKCINGEKATFNTPVFAQKRERTLESLLRDLYNEHTQGDNNKAMLSRRAFSDALVDSTKSSNKKEETRKMEFSRIGQALKLDTIMKGDAPTSLASSTSPKREPWQPECVFPDFSYDIVCGDSWGNDRLILATETSGAFVIEGGIQPYPIFERSVVIRQISVIEEYGLMIVRMDKAKDSKVYIFRLKEFEAEPIAFYTKSDCKDHRIEGSKGCLFFSLNRLSSNHLRMAIALSKKITLFQYKYSLAYASLSQDEDSINGFLPIQELNLNETPVLITLIDAPLAADNRVCVGYKNSFDLINEHTGEVLNLYQTEGGKGNLIAALDVCEDDEKEFLLCYHNTCHFQKLDVSLDTKAFDFQWCSVPDDIICASPYILAFNAEGIEIRLLINGNLVYSATMPNMKLLTSKNDIYFVTTAPELISFGPNSVVGRESAPLVAALKENPNMTNNTIPSSPNSPNYAKKPFRVYRIALGSLTGHERSPSSIGESRTTPSSPYLSTRNVNGLSFAAPSISVNYATAEPSPTRRSPSPKAKHRIDTSSSDSGMVNTSINSVAGSPPPSPV